MKFQIEINIKKIVTFQYQQIVIYCDKPRALGEVLRHNHGLHKFAVHVWGQGVTLEANDFNTVKHLFEGIEIVTETQSTQGTL